MRRLAGIFSISLLLTICSQVCAVEFQPPVYRSNKVSGAGVSRSIRGLLVKRQTCNPGYGYCSRTGVCCPSGGQCCYDGNCCPAGEWCSAPGHCCYNNQNSCQSIYCCNKGEGCCRDGGCCSSGWYCAVASDGQIGCCPNGQVCSGSIGGGGGGGGGGNGGGGATTTTEPSPPPPPTTTSTTSTPPVNTLPPVTTPISSTPSSPQPSPTPDVGYTNVQVGIDSVEIAWSAGWTVQLSSCDSTLQAKITVTADEWLTYVTPPGISPYVYLDTASFGVDVSIYINGLQQSNTNLDNCSYTRLGPMVTASFSNNITISINGASLSGRGLQSANQAMSFQFNQFIIGKQLGAATSTGAGSTATTFHFGGATRDKPQMFTLLSLVSLLLVAMFWA